MPLFDPSNNELISLIKINRGANTSLDISGMPSLSARERNFQKERVREDGWREVRGAMYKQQDGREKLRSKRKKSKKETRSDGDRQAVEKTG